MTQRREITIKLIRREDDGLRVYSDDVRGRPKKVDYLREIGL